MKRYPQSVHSYYNFSKATMKRLANLEGIVINWLISHEYVYPEYLIKPSPRRLILSLYLSLRSREFDLQNKEKYICQLVDRNNNLQKRIANLEEYEKEVLYKDYKFIITTTLWSCGDGCCSDSWANYKVINTATDYVVENTDSGDKSYIDKYRLASRLKEKYGQSIKIDYMIKDDDREYEDYNAY